MVLTATNNSCPDQLIHLMLQICDFSNFDIFFLSLLTKRTYPPHPKKESLKIVCKRQGKKLLDFFLRLFQFLECVGTQGTANNN